MTAAFDAMRAAIIVTTPSDGEIVDPRFEILERSTGFALDGTTYRRARVTGLPDDDARLIVGAEGVTYANVDQLLTVCFEDCVAAVKYPSGAVSLFDIDGTTIEVAPDDWRDGDRALAPIEAAIPDDILVVARRPFGVTSPAFDAELDDDEDEATDGDDADDAGWPAPLARDDPEDDA